MVRRTNDEISIDIGKSGIITRQDIYEVIKNTPGKNLAEKIPGIEAFIESLPEEIREKVAGNGKTTKVNILSDLSSYPK